MPYLPGRGEVIKERMTPKPKNATTPARNVRNFVHRDDDGGQEFVGDGLHVLNGGLQSGPHLLVAHGLLWGHVIRQLTGRGRKRKRVWDESLSADGTDVLQEEKGTSFSAHLASPVWVSIWLTQLL